MGKEGNTHPTATSIGGNSHGSKKIRKWKMYALSFALIRALEYWVRRFFAITTFIWSVVFLDG